MHLLVVLFLELGHLFEVCLAVDIYAGKNSETVAFWIGLLINQR